VFAAPWLVPVAAIPVCSKRSRGLTGWMMLSDFPVDDDGESCVFRSVLLLYSSHRRWLARVKTLQSTLRELLNARNAAAQLAVVFWTFADVAQDLLDILST